MLRVRVKSSQISSGFGIFLYRGVHAGHPGLEAAKAGIVVPGDLNGTASAEEHNLGSVSARSAFTSWTPHMEIARNYARRSGAGGVLLRIATGSPLAEDSWSWEWSPDEYGEGEILLRGRRSGATVELL
jgi:hypothetical protein